MAASSTSFDDPETITYRHRKFTPSFKVFGKHKRYGSGGGIRREFSPEPQEESDSSPDYGSEIYDPTFEHGRSFDDDDLTLKGSKAIGGGIKE